jgi:hypothetical protein
MRRGEERRASCKATHLRLQLLHDARLLRRRLRGADEVAYQVRLRVFPRPRARRLLERRHLLAQGGHELVGPVGAAEVRDARLVLVLRLELLYDRLQLLYARLLRSKNPLSDES